MFENIQQGPIAVFNPVTDKSYHDIKNKSTVAPLQMSPPNSQKRSLKKLGIYQFSMDQRIGSGMSGDAYVGINTQTRELVCIKVIDRQIFKSPTQKVLLDNQIRCQEVCKSNYTIKIYDIFDTSSFCFIVTQFCEGGDLYRFLRATANGMSEELVLHFGKQIALALKKLKDAKIIHRDIKSQNILLQKGNCKLGDFGFAIEQNKLNSQQKFNLGSPLYMSIEALQNSIYSFSSDIFSFGVVLYEMLHRQSPWECTDQFQLLQKMKNEEPTFKSGIRGELKCLIKKCLSQNSSDRPTIQQILDNSLFADKQPVLGTS